MKIKIWISKKIYRELHANVNRLFYSCIYKERWLCRSTVIKVWIDVLVNSRKMSLCVWFNFFFENPFVDSFMHFSYSCFLLPNKFIDNIPTTSVANADSFVINFIFYNIFFFSFNRSIDSWWFSFKSLQ